MVNYATLKAEGRRIDRIGSSEFWRLGDKVYRARPTSFGGFTGTNGFKVESIAEIIGHTPNDNRNKTREEVVCPV
jgi:hypothetical protein